MIQTRRLVVLSFSFSLLLSQKLFAWGDIGHDTVWTVAYPQLILQAKQAVDDLFSDLVDRPKDLAGVPVFADDVKHTKGYEHTAVLHYADSSQGVSYFQVLSTKIKNALDQKKSLTTVGDVVLGILHAEDILRNPNYPKRDPQGLVENKEDALRFLIHFMGDVHQPLHFGFPEDQGGNQIKEGAQWKNQTVHFTLNGNPASWKGKPLNLHFVWDEVIIGLSYADKFGSLNPDPHNSAIIYGKLLGTPSPSNLAAWTKSLSPYLFGAELVPYLLPRLDPNGNEKGVYRSDAQYNLDQYVPAQKRIVDLRILQAGSRLAAILNQIFDPNSQVNAGELQLRAQLNQLFRSFDDVAPAPISLEQIVHLRKEPVVTSDVPTFTH